MNTDYLMWANILVWAGVGLYVLIMARKQTRLNRRIEQVEMSLHDHNEQ